MKALVIGQLLPEQEKAILEKFDSFKQVVIPKSGWTIAETTYSKEYPFRAGDVLRKLLDAVYDDSSTETTGGCVLWTYNTVLVFTSPIPPALLITLARHFSTREVLLVISEDGSLV